jgi:glycosyltransferase involved in cell wall biosynthesis
MPSPKVSIITPIYGVEKYISRYAHSVLEQSFDDIEYIFVNDCTKDKSMTILKDIIEQYPLRKNRVKIINNDKNLGLCLSRYEGIKASTGDYIINCDSDDWLDKEMVEKMYEFVQINSLDIAWCDFYISDGKKHTYLSQESSTSKIDYLKSMLTIKIISSLCNKIIKRTLFFNNEICPAVANMGEDFVLLFQFVFFSNKIGYIPSPFYYYYMRNDSITHHAKERNKQLRLIEDSSKNLQIIEKLMIKWDLCKVLDKELVFHKFIKKQRTLILPIDNITCRNWRQIHPEINFSFLLCPLISIKDKLRGLLILTRLYPLRNLFK